MDSELIDKILDEVSFERQFYEAIAETDEYDVISFEANTSEPLHVKEEIQRRAIETQCERTGMRILYRISYGDYAVVMCKEDGRVIGLIPETNPDGWEC